MTLSLVEELLNLRNKLHKDDFQFNLSESLWSSQYLSMDEISKGHLVQVRRNGVLAGYAVLAYSSAERNKICEVREMNADTNDTFRQLIDRVVEEAIKQNADFVTWRKCQEPLDNILQEKGFLTFHESVIMIALLNPKDFLKTFSEKVETGKIARLNIEGSEPVFLRVKKNKFSIVENSPEDFKISIDGLTFIRLFFGKSSFFTEWLTGKIKVSISHYRIAKRLFTIVRNKRWYIPSGDWC